jgi:hypothetical protein
MRSSGEEIYVFVVCGSQEHIETLHYSIQALQKVSSKKILVVTDPTRNEVPVVHTEIINIETPVGYNHHQASIYLKTGLHKFLPKGNLYCYLDTDVVAVSSKVDTIFSQYMSPITFAPDHCVTDQFSPAAIKCDCAVQYAIWRKEVGELLKTYKDVKREPENEEKKARLLHILEEKKKDKWGYKWLSLRFNLARKTFKLDKDTYLNKKGEYWHDKDGKPVLYEKHIKTSVEIIESISDYRYEKEPDSRWLMNGKNVFDCRCEHLKEAIKKDFGIDVKDSQWQHWNGGVFLFDDSSAAFLNAWHEKTLRAFTLPEWKTRDQGTLIATVWEKGLQDHPTLDRKYNLIADYLHRDIEHRGDLLFCLKPQMMEVRPYFVHVYHHWADKRWDVWQAVERATGIEIDIDTCTINSLWIGKTLSKLELLTIHSFLTLGYRFRLWLYEPLHTPLPEGIIIGDANEIVPREKVFSYRNKNKYGHGKGSYAGFSDIFRYKLLYEKGGWWVDMDVTCLKALDFDQPYFFRSHHDLKVVGNVMKCPKHSALMKLCYEEAIETVTEDNTDWHKPINILNENIAKLDLERYIKYDVSNEDMWDITSRYIWTDAAIPEHWYFLHWQNEEWRMKKVNRDQFFFRSALAELMRKFHLTEMPKSKTEEMMNNMRHSEFVRKIRIFN